MRPFSASVPVVPVTNRFEGGLGAALYLGAAGVDDPSKIEYRRVRTIRGNWFVVGDDWAPGSNPFLGDCIAAIVKSPTEQISVALAAAYNDVVFWAQVRTHQAGIENDSIWRPQRVVVDTSADVVSAINGTGRVTRIEKLDAGGMRVAFQFVPGAGLQPTEFELSRTSGPTSPAAVTVNVVAGVIAYVLEVSSLQDAGAYVFALKAKNGATTQTIGTVNFTGDASGPGAVQSLATCEV